MKVDRDVPNGLVKKWAIRPHSSKEANEECYRLRAEKIEYAQDEEGRIWRRIFRINRRVYGRVFYENTRWHIADMYAWFPGEDPSTISGARRQNTNARPPKKFDVYWVDEKPLVTMRSGSEF